jgi:transposase
MSKHKLKKLVDTLDLSFVDRFQQQRRRKVGRKGFKPSSYLKAWIIGHLLGIPSERQLVQRLQDDPFLKRRCRFPRVPCRAAFCRARKRLGLKSLEHLFDWLVQKAKAMGIVSARIVAMDSTDYEAYCKGNKKLNLRSDQNARWGYSTLRGRVFGYKVHYICDTEAELPLAMMVLPANHHDSEAFAPVFKKLLGHFVSGIQKFLADCAYDASHIRQALHDIKAVIARNGRGKFESETPKDPDYGKRVAIERINSRAKLELGLDNLKMRGLWAATFHAQIVMCSMLYAAIGGKLAGFPDWRSIVSLR